MFERLWGRNVNAAGGGLCVAGEACVAGESGAGAGEFAGFPAGVAIDNSLGLTHGLVYVVDDGNNRVQEFNGEGGFVLMFGKNVNSNTHGDVCTSGEAAACQAGESTSAAGGFSGLEGNGVAVDNAGVVYVADENRVQKFDSGGGLIGEVALPGVGRITGLAVDSAKHLYVVASGLSGVHEYSAAGVEILPVRDPAANPNETVITVSPSDDLFVYDNVQKHVQEYALAGGQLSSILLESPLPSGGLAFKSELGVLYVLLPEEVVVLGVPAEGPVVVAGSERVDGVLPRSVVTHAIVNPEGTASEYRVEYGTSAAYGSSVAGGAPLTAVNEVQSVTVSKATGGKFTLGFEGEETGELPFNATAGEVQAKLEGLAKLGVGQVAVSGEPGGPWAVEYTGSRGGQSVSELTTQAGALTGEPGETPSVTVAVSVQGISLFDDRPVSIAVSGLQPKTVYHYRFVATDGSHTTPGPDATFETASAVSVEAESATEVTGDSARLEAILNAHGVASSFHFEYGTSTSYGSSAPASDESFGSGSEGVNVHVQLQGLSAATVYHYRVVAHNELGEVQGPDETFTTQAAAPVKQLVDGRQQELVSPPSKHGSPLEGLAEEGAMIQAAEDGHALTYVAQAPISNGTPGSRSVANTQLISARTTPGVWATRDISTPHEQVSAVITGRRSEYLAFSSDLSLGALEAVGSTPLNPAAMGERKERTPYLRKSSPERTPLTTEEFVPLVTEANTPPGTQFAGTEEHPGGGDFVGGTSFVALTPDGSKAILAATPPLTQGASESNLYEWQAGKLTLASEIAEAPATVCGGSGPACIQTATRAALGNNDEQTRGALSDDGARVVFETDNEHLWLRDLARKETVLLNASTSGVRPHFGEVRFQIASSDGSRVFFTDIARLTPDATARSGQPDLYMCDMKVVAGRLSCGLQDLTVDSNRNEAANVLGDVIGIDTTGRYVYFVAAGALTPGAADGGCEKEQMLGALCNVYVRDVVAGATSLVAVVSDSDLPDWQAKPLGSNLGEMTSGVSGNGRFLAFMSSRSLTGFDNRDAVSGVRDVEVFEFDRERGSLVCVSCGGGRPHGMFEPSSVAGAPPLVDRTHVWGNQWLAALIPGWTRITLGFASYRSRYLFDSGRLFFNSVVGLVAGDGNGRADVYEFEPSGVAGCPSVGAGCVGLLSGGSSSDESAFLDASGSGDDVFFLTGAQLAPGVDVDGALDVYDAHVCTAGVPCVSGVVSLPPGCSTADSCRAAPAPRPDVFGAPASQLFSGSGNVTPGPGPKVKSAAEVRAEKLARALKACRKVRFKRKRAVCVKQARKKYGPVKSRVRGRKAGNGQGAGR